MIPLRLLALLFAVHLAACSGTTAPLADAGESGIDAGAGAPDAAPLTLCPTEANPMCKKANDCMTDEMPPSNCAACRPYNHSVCTIGSCATPDSLLAGDIQNFRFQVGSLLPRLQSFAGFVIDTETAGGSKITCADIYAGRVSLDERCYNILDSLGRGVTGAMGDTYPFTFSGFASGRPSLVVIYGYAMDGAQGNPIGVSCTALDAVVPMSGINNVAGDMMKPI